MNELLAAIYVNIEQYNEDKSEGGLQSITIDKLPSHCELDGMLLNNIALMTKNCRVFGFRRNVNLQIETRQSLVNMLNTMMQPGPEGIDAPIEIFGLDKFSNEPQEGRQVIEMLM